jgi:hypothetical protein
MPGSADPTTQTTRLAANIAAAGVVIYALLWLLSTQVDAIRAVSPFAEDPWDAIATYAAIFLPFVAGATWIRSLRHRGPALAAATARRIRRGSGVAAAIVLVAAAADAQAIATIGFAPEAGRSAALIGVLVVGSILASVVAIALTARAAWIASAVGSSEPVTEPMTDATFEPDIVDDVLALAADVARPLGLRPQVARFGAWLEAILEQAAWSPRRHRIAFGLALSVAAGASFAIWHGIREGAPPSLLVPLMFTVLLGSGVFAAWLGTVGPLRLLRPPHGSA